MSAHPIHPAVAPVIDALRALANYQPTSPADLADVLKSVHEITGPCVIEALADALRSLGWRTGHQQVTDRLEDAIGKLYALGPEHIDRARADTGHYNGTGITDSYL